MSQTDRRTGLVGNTGIKQPVRVATTANITLSGEQTIDGVAVVDGDRVLVKDQTTAANNGIYECDTSTWNRTKDMDGSYDLMNGTLVYVRTGTTNGNKIFKCTATDPITIGTTSLSFAVVDIELSASVDVRWCGTATGTANALVLTPSTAVSALTSGLTLIFKTGAAANTGAVTINVSSLGNTTTQLNGAAMVAGDLEASQWYMATYDGTNYQTQKIGIPNLIHGFTADADITMSGASIVEAEGAAVASAATTNIWATDGNTVHVTGTTTITSFGTAPQAGAWQKIVFDDALTLTHGANLNLPGSANIPTAAGDFAFVYADTTTQFDVLYFKKDGTPVVGSSAASQAEMEAASDNTKMATPANANWHPGVAKAWLMCGVTGNIIASHNITSVTDDSTGIVTVTIATDFSSANYVVVGITQQAGGTGETVRLWSQAAGTFTARCVNDAGTVADPTYWYFVCFGDQ